MKDSAREPVYFDNAATSWPKPPEVPAAISGWFADAGGSPGRSGHRLSVASGRILEDVRGRVADLFSFPDPLRVVFCKNATEALNTAIFSLAAPGSHVVASSGEHNSVMRPLRHLEKTAGVRLTLAGVDSHGRWSVESVMREMRPDTRLVVLGHASNVTGLHMPVERIWPLLAERGVPLLIDGAQAAGCLPVNLAEASGVAYAFTGHKGLMGPTGTGGLLIGEGVTLTPRLFGGTGSRSDSDVQPEGLPDSIESGTMNMVGVAGLGGALSFLNRVGVESVRRHERRLVERFIAEASRRVTGIAILGGMDPEAYLSTLSFTLKNLDPSQTGLVLDRKYNIQCRIGLHCNPNAHKALGTFPTGTVRFSFSAMTSLNDIDYAVDALAEMAKLR